MRDVESEGFGEFVAASARSLQRAAWLLTADWSKAEDLVQTSLIVTWQHWARARRAPTAYTHRVMTRTYLRWQRRHWNGKSATADLHEKPVGDPSDDLATRADLSGALSALTPQQRAAIVCRYFADLTPEQTAEAEWLRAGTPQPPRVLTVEDIRAGAPGRHPRRRWMPILAAATVVGAVIVGVALGGTRAEHGSARPAGPTTPAQQSPSSPSPLTTTPPRALPVHPWHAKQLGSPSLAVDSTTVLDGRLYGLAGDGKSSTFYRLDPVDGQPLAHADHVYGGLRPVAAAGLIWIPSASTKEAWGLDPVTLAVEAAVRVPVRTGIAAQGSNTVVVSDNHHVSFIRAGRVTHQLTVAHQISSITMSADGTRLYVATELGSTPGPGQIEILDPRTGSPLAAPVRGLAVGLGLQASAGGIWFTSVSGMQAAIGFQPDGTRRTQWAGSVGSSGGGALTLPTVSDGVAWLGSANQLGCADPDTGTLRARVPVGSTHGNVIAAISGLTALDGRVFAVYNGINRGPARALIVMTPPSRCFGS